MQKEVINQSQSININLLNSGKNIAKSELQPLDKVFEYRIKSNAFWQFSKTKCSFENCSLSIYLEPLLIEIDR
jgi:hypothetical protein